MFFGIFLSNYDEKPDYFSVKNIPIKKSNVLKFVLRLHLFLKKKIHLSILFITFFLYHPM